MIEGCQKPARHANLSQSGRDSFGEGSFLLGEHRAQIQHHGIVFDSSDDGSRSSSTQALLDLRSREAVTADANNFGAKRLRRSRTAAGEGLAVGYFDVQAVHGDGPCQFTNEVAAAFFDFTRSGANHGHGRYFIEGAALVGTEGDFERGDNELIYTESAKERMAADAP